MSHFLFLVVHVLATSAAFAPIYLPGGRCNRALVLKRSTSTAQESVASSVPNSQPRSGLAQKLLDFALNSPLWDYVLVPQARESIVKTAEGK